MIMNSNYISYKNILRWHFNLMKMLPMCSLHYCGRWRNIHKLTNGLTRFIHGICFKCLTNSKKEYNNRSFFPFSNNSCKLI